MQTAEVCRPLLNLLVDEVLSGCCISIDETTLQVLQEPGRDPTSNSYMWLFRRGDPEKPTLIYVYHASRSGNVAKEFLCDFNGYVHTYGYGGYDFLDSREGVCHIGCWAHSRRKFMDVVKAQGKNHKVNKADFYTLNQWKKQIGYIEDGRLNIDNNLTENGIKPFVLGRKNWLFSGTPEGSGASALLFSLIETAKANKLEPYAYLRYIIDRLPLASELEAFEALLPWNLMPQMLCSNLAAASA